MGKIYKDIDIEMKSRFQIVAWDDKFNTGNELIDNQHKELIRLTNELYNACLSGKEAIKNIFPDTMKRMVNYVKFHFDAEQKYLEQINYPDFSMHIKMHEELVKKILDAVQNYQDNNKFTPIQFVKTLREWVLSHIGFYDKQYAHFAAEQRKKGLLDDTN